MFLAALLTPVGPRAADARDFSVPHTLFAVCAGRYHALADHGPAPDRPRNSERQIWFEDLVGAVGSGETDARSIELDAWGAMVLLLHNQRFSFDTETSVFAEHAIKRALAECDRLTFS